MSSPNQLSFLPDDYLERKAQRRTNFICAVLVVIVMAAIGAAFSLSEQGLRKVEAEHARAEADYADAARRIDQVQQMQAKQQKMARQAELSASLLEKVPRSYLLADVTNCLPAGVSLLDITLDSKKRASAAPAKPNVFDRPSGPAPAKAAASVLPVAEPIIYDVTMKLTGVASSDVQVAQFINALGRSKLLKDVNLIITDEATMNDEKVRRFQIEMALRSDADVRELERKPDSNTATVELPQ
jgi:Tfp pilus assembly protein PilN